MLARQLRIAQLVELATYAAIAVALVAWGWSAISAAALCLAAAAGVRLAIFAGMNILAWVHRCPPDAEHRIGPWRTLRMLLSECRAFMAMNLLWVPWEERLLRADPAPQRCAHLPVVLVHGFFVNRGLFVPLVPKLENAGIEPVFAPNGRARFATIEEFEEDLHAAIERIAAATGQRVVLIGHSMGGLVARAYLVRRGASRVARLVTIGSPHHGSALARFGMGPNARQMEPGSEFLETLRAREATSPHPPALSIYSTHDNMVAPQDSGRLPWARNVAVAGYGHLCVMACEPVMKLLLEEIRAARQAA